MTLARQIVYYMHPHFVVNVFLSVIYYPMKTVQPFCFMMFDDCNIELKEWEWLTFLGCIIVMKNRKQPSYKLYISTVCMFAKLLSVLLFFRQNPLMAIIYVILCLLHIAFLPEPMYSGPEFVTYFKGTSDLEQELEHDKRVNWVICFYAAWSPTCVNLAPLFAELSAQYHLDNLRFGKVDVTRNPQLAEQYKISTSSWTKQLPTIIHFQGGKEYTREPMISHKGSVLNKFIFSKENINRSFALNELHNTCKKNPIKKRRGKQDLESKPEDEANGKPKTE